MYPSESEAEHEILKHRGDLTEKREIIKEY